MSKTIALRTEIKKELESICPNIFYARATSPYKYPYLVFELQELTFADNKTVLQLEVNAVAYGDETKLIEVLCDQVQDQFDGTHVLTETLHLSIYKDKRQNVDESDKKVIRRRMLFEIHLHERR